MVLGLFLITSSQADDIRDFQIEGMSLGDSLLDYFSEEEILAYKPNWFKNNEYSIANNLRSKSFEIYTSTQVAYKTKDKKYIIEGIEGYKFYEKIEVCLKEQDVIIDSISDIYPNLKKGEKETYKHNDPNTDATITSINFHLKSGEKIGIGCTDTKGLVPPIDLRVILRTEEYDYFINNEAYK